MTSLNAEAPQVGPDDKAFDPKAHFRSGGRWWTRDKRYWWDGEKWIDTEALRGKPPGTRPQSVRATRDPRSRKVARIISGSAHASVLGLLAAPFVAFEGGCSSIVDAHFSGYQALVGPSLPDVQLRLPSLAYISMPSYGPNLWIALVIVVALAGVAAAWVGGLRAAVARLATAVIAITATWVAVSAPYPSSFDVYGDTVFVHADSAPPVITLVLVIALFTDLVSVIIMSSGRPGRELTPAVTNPIESQTLDEPPPPP